MPLKFVIGPATPPETLRLAQFQVPVQAPTPQFTATWSAPLLTVSEVVAPVKLTPWEPGLSSANIY